MPVGSKKAESTYAFRTRAVCLVEGVIHDILYSENYYYSIHSSPLDGDFIQHFVQFNAKEQGMYM